MTLRVLLFGPVADAAGARSVKINLADGSANARGVLDAVGAAYPKAAPLLRAATLAVNQQFVRGDHPVQPGDELAVIGMVSGG